MWFRKYILSYLQDLYEDDVMILDAYYEVSFALCNIVQSWIYIFTRCKWLFIIEM